MRSSNDEVPAAYLAEGAWPRAVLREDAPVSALYGQALARRLAEALADRGASIRSLAERAGVNHSTVSRLLAGRVLVDIGTLARLEAAMGMGIWPGLDALAPRPESTRSSEGGVN